MAIVERGVAQRRQDPRKRVLVAHGDSSFAVMSEPPVLDGAVQFSGTDIADPVVAEGPFRHRADGTGLDPAPPNSRSISPLRQPCKVHRRLWNRAGYGPRNGMGPVVLPRVGLRGEVLHLRELLPGQVYCGEECRRRMRRRQTRLANRKHQDSPKESSITATGNGSTGQSAACA